jgi:alpha-ketoglutaric semialdehyde dehydrogenase
MRPSDTDETVTSLNPADPTSVIGTFELKGADRLKVAVGEAVRVQPAWAAAAAARAAALTGWANAVEADGAALALLIAHEVGKPIVEARAEVSRTVAIVRFYAQAALDSNGEIYPGASGTDTLMTDRMALGVVLVVCPWNFPAAIPIWKIAPALAYGNAVLFKPSSSAIAVADRLVGLGSAHLPSGVLALLPSRSSDAAILIDDERVAAVSFTGSAPVGSALVGRLAARGAAVQAEMGGQNPSIVLADADLEFTARTIAQASMAFAGQKCTATSRVIVLRGVAERFIPLLVDAVRALSCGDPTDNATSVGPLINEAARDATADAVAAALGRGGKALTGATQLERPGWFYPPTLVQLDDPADPFAQEETFGPAASVLLVDSIDDAIAVANGTPYGLSAAVFGTDIDRALGVARRIDAGLLRVNAATTGVDYYAPFGGSKASSYGPREQGRAAREFYTRTRTMLVSRPVPNGARA